MTSALVLALALSGCVRTLPPTMQPGRLLPYRTADGWQSQVRHYPGAGEPVLLVHGLGANHYNFDYRPEVSLAHYLQQRGYDVWVPELRGDPGATPPSRRARKLTTFDDHALLDIPAVIDAVRAETGADDLLWVGHSMGGMLAFAALRERPEHIRAAVAICSPATFEHQLRAYGLLKAARWTLGGNARIPARALAAVSAPLGRFNPMYARLANRKNLDWPVANGMARHALNDLTRPMARQAFTWIQSRELVDLQGEAWVVPDDTPVFALGGSVDKVVAEADARHACAVFPDCRYQLLGVEGGMSVEYGHIDPVVGVTAEIEVYPLIGAFLDEHATPSVGGVPDG